MPASGKSWEDILELLLKKMYKAYLLKKGSTSAASGAGEDDDEGDDDGGNEKETSTISNSSDDDVTVPGTYRPMGWACFIVFGEYAVQAHGARKCPILVLTPADADAIEGGGRAEFRKKSAESRKQNALSVPALPPAHVVDFMAPVKLLVEQFGAMAAARRPARTHVTIATEMSTMNALMASPHINATSMALYERSLAALESEYLICLGAAESSNAKATALAAKASIPSVPSTPVSFSENAVTDIAEHDDDSQADENVLPLQGNVSQKRVRRTNEEIAEGRANGTIKPKKTKKDPAAFLL